MVKTLLLQNGVRVVTEQRPGTGTVAIQISIKSGGVDEAAAESGLTNLMQEATQTGTATRSRDQIALDIEAKASPIESRTDMETTMFRTKALARSAPDAFNVLADVLLNPVFNADELEQVKEQIIQGIKQAEKQPAAAAGKKYMETAFAGQSLGRPTTGTTQQVAAYTTGDVKRKHAEILSRPGDIIVSFAGDIDPAVAEKLVQDTLGQLSGGSKAPNATARFTAGDYREDNASNQVNINLGFKAPNGLDPDRYDVTMFNALLSGGMSAPLFQELRVKRGLVYTPQSSFWQYENAGTFVISNGTGKGKAGELLTAVVELLGRIAREGFTQEQLDQARESVIRSVRDGRESVGSAASINAGQVLKYGRVLAPGEFEQKLRDITLDDVRRVAVNLLKEGEFALSAVGPQETMPTSADLKELITRQVAGIVVPEKPAKPPGVAGVFNAVAQETPVASSPQVTVLQNGLKIITVERAGPLSVGGWVGAGSDHETAELNGATHLNEHMMFRGTPSYPSGTIDKTVEGEMGAGLNAYTTNDKTVYYIYSLLPEHLERSLNIVGEMIFKADIAQTELAGAPVTLPDGSVVPGKGEIEAVIEELNMGRDKPGRIAYQVMMSQAYAGSTHGETVIGTEPVLRAMTADMLRAYRDEYYSSNNVIFGAVGPVKHEDFVKMVAEKYGDLQPTDFPPLPVPAYKGGTLVQEHKAAELATVYIAAEGVPTASPELPAYEALGIIMGGGFASRLQKSLVNDLELAIGAGAGTSEYRNAGTFQFSLAVKPDKLRDAVKEVYAELRRLPGNITEAELERAKSMLELGIRSSYEMNNDAIDAYAVDLQAAGRLVTPQDKIDAINALTLVDIRRVAGKVLSSNPAVAMIVPVGTDPALLPQHADILRLRDGAATGAPISKPKPPAHAA
ncbi:MAG TPA: pitrilysin family protein [Patescibacteria group bacterium]|nr:pitrilysin family protein [Patescibacteria group bacterium]